MTEPQGLTYDYRLGYVRSGSVVSGFDVFGEDNAPDGRIVTLGGYTSNDQAIQHTSWADSLYNLFHGTVQIYNGCTDGYTSAQELLMLIRDGILLQPKLVVCFSGFYNVAYKLGFVKSKDDAKILHSHPFTTPGQIAFYRSLSSRFGLGNDKMFYGEENTLPAWEYWMLQVDMMHCICEEFGISHITFLQPCVFSGQYRYSPDEAAMLAEDFGLSSGQFTELASQFHAQYALAAKAAQNRDYITDLSALFDEHTGVYRDACHVKDSFTDKIAEAVFGYIRTGGRR